MFYDFNEDGLDELLIGTNNSISGIYTLQNEKPVSVLQIEDRYTLMFMDRCWTNVDCQF